MALVTCDHVSFAYEGHTVVDGLTLSIEKGEYLCIVGENGSGKSTLVKGLLGLLKPSAGKVSYGDGLRHNEIGYLPQRTEVQRDFPASVWEVVASGLRGKQTMPFVRGEAKARAMRLIKLLGIEGIRRKSFMELSGGQQQRVLLARALCATQSMLLLDEPVAGLDPLVTREMYELIAELNRAHGLTVVMISHDIGEALHYATRVLHMAHGQTFLGTPEEYRQSELGRAFSGGGKA